MKGRRGEAASARSVLIMLLATAWYAPAPLQTPPELLTQAQARAQAGEWQEAKSLVERYLQTHSDSADAHALLAFLLFKEDQPKQSLEHYSIAAKVRRLSPFELKIMGLDYAMMRDYALASRWLSQSLEARPADLQACTSLGEVKALLGRHEEGAAVFQKCLQIDPKNSFAANGLGVLLELLGRYPEAVLAYRDAAGWEANKPAPDPTPFLNLGRTLLKQNKVEEAVTYLNRAVELAPAYAVGHEHLSRAYAYTNQLESAQRELEKAVALDPGNARLHYVLGRLYRERGLTEKAQSEFERFRALKQKDEGETTPD